MHASNFVMHHRAVFRTVSHQSSNEEEEDATVLCINCLPGT